MARIVGILGGMGPQATVDLMNKIIAATPARQEADHVHMIVDCNPTVPPRTRALLDGGTSPAPDLADMARRLVTAGADVLVMPCNTAHAFAGAITAAAHVPFLDMIDLAADEVRARAPAATRVGLVATRGTRRTRLYHDRLEARGLSVVDLDEEEQHRLDGLVARIKTHEATPEQRAAMHELLAGLASRGAEVVLAGCTEVPLLLPAAPPVRVIDPSEVLARAVVTSCERGAERAG